MVVTFRGGRLLTDICSQAQLKTAPNWPKVVTLREFGGFRSSKAAPSICLHRKFAHTI